jgi:hypothetical protein
MMGCLTQRYVERQDSTRGSAEIRRLFNFRSPYFETLLEGKFLGGVYLLNRRRHAMTERVDFEP